MPPKLTLMDGGLGTVLTDIYSIPFSADTPLWSSHLLLTPSGQETLLSAQKSFVEAGADVVLSASYQASFEGFKATKNLEGEQDGAGVGEFEAGRFMRDSVFIARKAFAGGENGKGKVALSLGAYGATMIPSTEYSGAYDPEHRGVEELSGWHLRRLHVFTYLGPSNSEPKTALEAERKACWENVDMIAFETLPLINEIHAVRAALSSLPTWALKPFWISCVFPGEEGLLPDGSTVGEMIGAMIGFNGRVMPMGIGINCTKVEKVEGLILEIEGEVGMLRKEGEEWPVLVVYPDGTRGEVYNTVTKGWEMGVGGENLLDWDEMIFGIVKRVRERGLWKEIFVGGCCKTTPEHIQRLRGSIDELESN